MAIKVQPRANVPDDFVDLVVDISFKKIKQFQRELDALSPAQRKIHMAKISATVARLSLLARRDAGAIDQLKTVLRSLPYTEYGVKTMPIFRPRPGEETGIFQSTSTLIAMSSWMNTLFLYGVTKDVTVELIEEHHARGKTVETVTEKWDMGPYQILVPVEAFFHSSESLWQFLPVRDPNIYARTPHHHAGGYDATKPEFWLAKTCWGHFGSVMVSLKNDADIPEIFRTLHFYVTRYNPNSVLSGRINTTAYPFAKQVPL